MRTTVQFPSKQSGLWLVRRYSFIFGIFWLFCLTTPIMRIYDKFYCMQLSLSSIYCTLFTVYNFVENETVVFLFFTPARQEAVWWNCIPKRSIIWRTLSWPSTSFWQQRLCRQCSHRDYWPQNSHNSLLVRCRCILWSFTSWSRLRPKGLCTFDWFKTWFQAIN